MSDQYPPYRPEGQPNPAGWNDPWPKHGDSSTPPPNTPPPAGAGGAGSGSAPGSQWDPNNDNAPTHLVTPPGGPVQPNAWQASTDGGQQQPGGGWPTGPDSGGQGGQDGWGPPQPNPGNPPSWPPQQPYDPTQQQPYDPQQQWQPPAPDSQWGQQPGSGAWPQQHPYPQQPNPAQQPGYGYQQGWPQPGGAPPGGPPGGKKTNPAFIVAPLALVAAIVLGVVIALVVRGDGDDDDQAIRPVSAPSVTTLPELTTAPDPGASQSPPAVAPAPAGAPPGAPDCSPVSPVGGAPAGGPDPVYDIGQTANVVSDDEYDIADFEANVTVNSVCTQTTAFNDYSDPPVQGSYVLADVTVEVVAGEVNATYFDFSVQTVDGARYEGDFPPIEPRLAEFDLAAGNTVRGFILVDAPAGNHLLRWEPSFATSVGLWRY